MYSLNRSNYEIFNSSLSIYRINDRFVIIYTFIYSLLYITRGEYIIYEYIINNSLFGYIDFYKEYNSKLLYNGSTK